MIKVRWFVSALIALLVFYFLKQFAYDIVRINNNDMKASFNKGDAVLIKKIGNTYELSDLIYFEYPVHDSILSHTFIIQRLYGLPGDSILIEAKHVYRNGELLAKKPFIKHNYFVRSKNVKLEKAFKDCYHLNEGGEISIDYDYSFSLTQEECDSLKKDSLIKSVELKTEKKYAFDITCFPWDEAFRWNLDFYGPIYVPKIGDTLKLDETNLKLYSALIVDYEKNNLEFHNDSLFINGISTTIYVVKKNYYFVLGDNRDNANDSRVWGLLPENNIRGKVISKLRSVE